MHTNDPYYLKCFGMLWDTEGVKLFMFCKAFVLHIAFKAECYSTTEQLTQIVSFFD